MPTLKLVSLHVSPWSERAKWALDHHRLPYTRIEHAPVVGERRLRRLVGPSKPTATVPVLLTGTEVIDESWDIARYADRHGTAPLKLIPEGQEAAIRGWATRADEAIQAGRPLLLAAMLASPAALDEGLPPAIPRFLRPLLRPLTRRATLAFVRKYKMNLNDAGTQKAVIRKTLDAARLALAKQPDGGKYLLGAFSYADIALATVLQSISPLAERYLTAGPATRALWTKPDLASEYADLVQWRNALYDRHRRG